jgi:dephospho-CoA kinase
MFTRKYASGYEKLKKKKKKKKRKKKKRKVEQLIESQRGALNKFVISNKQNIEASKNLIDEQEIHQKEEKYYRYIYLYCNKYLWPRPMKKY